MSAMFGRKHHDDAREAPADVLQAQQTQWAVAMGPDQATAETALMWRVHLRVRPHGEEPFEADVDHAFPPSAPPHPGQVLPVHYDPKDHTKVTLDPGEGSAAPPANPIIAMIEQHLGPEQMAAIERLGMGSVEQFFQAAMADPRGFAAHIQERAMAAQQAALAAQAAQGAVGGVAQPTASPVVQTTPPAPGADPVDLLARLADLRDRGALTPEEFEAQKKRILGQ
jgi:Short C-terminal domain